MLPDLIGLLAVSLVLAAPFASRCLRHSRDARTAGGPPARPVPQPAGRAAVPAVTIQPSSVMTGPFAYDNGLVVERPEGETS